MKISTTFRLCSLLLMSIVYSWPSAAATASDASPSYVLQNSQLRVLPRAANGHDYRLLIALPANYENEPNRRYPVLYACDGDWSFVLLCGMYGGLNYDGVVPDYILVGIGYAGENPDIAGLRIYDYTPVARPDDPAARHSGHAADFLGVVQKEIIPFVEREYRVNPNYRVLGGGSAGGTFALYTMFTQPDLFQGYIAVSPATGTPSGISDIEGNFAKRGVPLKTRLFMSGASEDSADFLRNIQTFDTQLKDRKYADLVYEWRLVQGQGHGGTGPESFARGIRFAFQPIAPKPRAH